jgi:hypothetical protein
LSPSTGKNHNISYCRGILARKLTEPRNALRPRSRHGQHVPADRRRLLLLRKTVAVLGILQAA